MIINKDIVQGTEEWNQARLGIPTSSNFDKIVTTKGVASKSQKKYMYKLAGERVTGIKENGYQNQSMLRGIETEAEAIQFYEMNHGVTVEKVGICYLDETKAIGSSPDGLVNDNGLVEIKCPEMHTHVDYLINDGLYIDYFQQCQGQLFVTGRQYVDLVSYYPGLRAIIYRVTRDEKFLALLEIELNKFCKNLDEITKRIR